MIEKYQQHNNMTNTIALCKTVITVSSGVKWPYKVITEILNKSMLYKHYL